MVSLQASFNICMAKDSIRSRGFSFVCVFFFFLWWQAVTCFCYGRSAARRSGVVTQTGETVGAEELRAPSKKTLQRLYLVSASPPGRHIFHTVTLFIFFFRVSSKWINAQVHK